MMNKIKNSKGITLITLVITIIVLVIIAFGIELFLEKTHMISERYRPLCATYDAIVSKFKK